MARRDIDIALDSRKFNSQHYLCASECAHACACVWLFRLFLKVYVTAPGSFPHAPRSRTEKLAEPSPTQPSSPSSTLAIAYFIVRII